MPSEGRLSLRTTRAKSTRPIRLPSDFAPRVGAMVQGALMGSENGKPSKAATSTGPAPASHDRRAALRRLSGYAMSVAPAMVILTGSGHAGNGSGSGGGDPQAPCDNP